uniref:Uncharacterized protein n=1 Tax=Vespula pensylvanica TaxID=30213 RepID=A0A834PCB6_VESPE|nr:hypothetical protein H0235_003688 [Vespula pensylvanica]
MERGIEERGSSRNVCIFALRRAMAIGIALVHPFRTSYADESRIERVPEKRTTGERSLGKTSSRSANESPLSMTLPLIMWKPSANEWVVSGQRLELVNNYQPRVPVW